MDSAKEKPSQGEITAVGPGGRDESGKLIPIDLKVGDRVLFGKWSGTEVVLDGEDLLMMKESDVVGVLTDVPVQRRRPLKPLVCTCRGSILLLAGAGAGVVSLAPVVMVRAFPLLCASLASPFPTIWRMPTVRLDQFDCRDLIKRLDLIARSQRNRLFGVTYNFKHASKDLIGDVDRQRLFVE